MRNFQKFFLLILSIKIQTSLFGKFTPSSNVIYPKGPTNNYERFVECYYYLRKSRSCKQNVISNAQKEWKEKYSNGRNADDLKTFKEKIEKQKLDISKKTFKKGGFVKTSKTIVDSSKSLPPKTRTLPPDPKRVLTDVSSSIPDKVFVLEDKTEDVTTTRLLS